MYAAQARKIAEECMMYARNGNFEKASKIRQQAYAISPPGTIGIDWSDWSLVWKFDKRQLKYLDQEDYSDLKNSAEYVLSLKAGIFIDYLFGFKNCWGVDKHEQLCIEVFDCPKLEKYLSKKKWDFQSFNRLHAYTNTKKININSKIFLSCASSPKLLRSISHPVYKRGEYYLGFTNETSIEYIKALRNRYINEDEYILMRKYNIDGFPKTFQTFEKHKTKNSEKYRYWLSQLENISTNK